MTRASRDVPESSVTAPPSPPPAAAPRLGIAGGGQLARMTAMAAAPLGVDVVVLERSPTHPAAAVAADTVVGDWRSVDGLRALAARVDVVTFENEFVDAALVAALEADGVVVRPSSRTLASVQDKLVQRNTLAAAGLPVPPFRSVTTSADVASFADAHGWPVVLKRRRDGYDGRGNATVHDAAGLPDAWNRLSGGAVYVEAFCPFVAELATMVVRSPSGASVAYPVVETVQRDHICHTVVAPGDISAAVASRATQVAHDAVAAVDAVGAMGVELFLTADGSIFVNELAPRVHNSGHYTIEACECSQFENHVRAVLGWPLGSPSMLAPAAAMVNLLGSGPGTGVPAGLDRALAVRGAHVHVYGKDASVRGRKMGHVTALGATRDIARATAMQAASHIQFGELVANGRA